MHFLRKYRSEQTPKGFAYWSYLFFGSLGAIAIVGIIGYAIDWITNHRSSDRNIALGFLLAYVAMALLAPNHYKFIFYSLISLIAFGILDAASHATLGGLPVVMCCALLAGLLVKWKGDGLLK